MSKIRKIFSVVAEYYTLGGMALTTVGTTVLLVLAVVEISRSI